ncbi:MULTISPECIES: DUF4166 domain-containing protein [unclassified Ruegeria]|uniref:DUF4166 domain-containing protein n=1 Tax=unclassified Ruegeria TaxID=2625375 RepID=UPI001487E557|nr:MULTISPECIES: DUF4166 domain-containing protein [unclassified Ruegeria]NOD63753.1 DUF4166 domain-containing protein [Ruegeria sp. HKCCD6109]
MSSDPFLQALGPNHSLPNAVQWLHSTEGQYSGQCDIERGAGFLTKIATNLAGFPPGGKGVPVSVTINRMGETLTWTRDFGGHCTTSHLIFDANRNCVREKFGAISIWLRPSLQNGVLHIEILRLTVFGVPLPAFALPRSNTREWQDAQGRFRFDVSANAPGLGLLIRYQGWLTPDHTMRGAG